MLRARAPACSGFAQTAEPIQSARFFIKVDRFYGVTSPGFTKLSDLPAGNRAGWVIVALTLLMQTVSSGLGVLQYVGVH